MSAEIESQNLSKLAHDYLASINPIACKINSEIEDVISTIQDHWSSLKPKEKEKIIGQ